MSTPNLKEQIMQMAASDVEQLLTIIGDMGYIGYKVALCNLHGYSLQQCANKFGVSKRAAQCAVEKCNAKGYATYLKKHFCIK